MIGTWGCLAPPLLRTLRVVDIVTESGNTWAEHALGCYLPGRRVARRWRYFGRYLIAQICCPLRILGPGDITASISGAKLGDHGIARRRRLGPRWLGRRLVPLSTPSDNRDDSDHDRCDHEQQEDASNKGVVESMNECEHEELFEDSRRHCERDYAEVRMVSAWRRSRRCYRCQLSARGPTPGLFLQEATSQTGLQAIGLGSLSWRPFPCRVEAQSAP